VIPTLLLTATLASDPSGGTRLSPPTPRRVAESYLFARSSQVELNPSRRNEFVDLPYTVHYEVADLATRYKLLATEETTRNFGVGYYDQLLTARRKYVETMTKNHHPTETK
jgi:hypothetical protein